MNKTPFSGSITALITPFKDGAIDVKAFQNFVQGQLDEGTNGFVTCSATGESPTLADDEIALLTRLCLEVVESRAPVIAACGSNNTAHAVHLTRGAEKIGADAALHVVPYYSMPSQEGLYQHFKAIHDNSDLPLFIKNDPSRCGVNVNVETLARLSELPRIIGVMDATGDLSLPLKTRASCGASFIQLSGDDETALAFQAQGGDGCISRIANIAPSLCARLQSAWRNGDVLAAQKLNDQLMPFTQTLLTETPVAALKYAASLLGKANNEVRLPLVTLSLQKEKAVREILVQTSLLNPAEAAA